MVTELISAKVRMEFREALVGFSTLGEIRSEFEAAGIGHDPNYEPNLSGQRRILVEQHYRTLDTTQVADARRLLRVFEATLDNLRSQARRSTGGAGPQQLYDDLVRRLSRDGISCEDGRLRLRHTVAGGAHLIEISRGEEAAFLEFQVERLQAAVGEQPDLAIGTAKELIETCCYTILARLGEPRLDKPDLTKLVTSTMEVLDLLPKGIPDDKKGSQAVKKTLGSAAAIVQGIAELRNLYGSGHGKDGKWRGLGPRHARLAANAAITVATFLLDTASERADNADPT